MEHLNILVFPCGSEVGLEINKSLKDIAFITLYGASSVNDHGMWEYKHYIADIPYITDEGFIDKFNEILQQHHIDFIFPALDSVALKLSEVRERLSAKVLTSSKETVRICRSKSMTYHALEGESFLPKVYESMNQVETYPIFVKPAVGQGAQGVRLVHSQVELADLLANRSEELVICEYLPGTEYTVDCFTDRNGVLKYCAHRSRQRIKSGISVNSVLETRNDKIEEIASKINAKMKFRGAWFFQVKVSNTGEYRLMEVATRIAGTMCVERARGVNLPLLTVFDALGYDLTIKPQFDSVETDRALKNCYRIDFAFDELYIDYDDTIIVHDSVNLEAIALLYQCVNRKIPIYLVTKHHKDIYEELAARKIARNLFDGIIHIHQDENKGDHISPSKNALFVDDSFAERNRMQQKFNIKAVGVDFLEVFLNGVKN